MWTAPPLLSTVIISVKIQGGRGRGGHECGPHRNTQQNRINNYSIILSWKLEYGSGKLLLKSSHTRQTIIFSSCASEPAWSFDPSPPFNYRAVEWCDLSCHCAQWLTCRELWREPLPVLHIVKSPSLHFFSFMLQVPISSSMTDVDKIGISD